MKRKEILKMSETEFQEWASREWERIHRFKQQALLIVVALALCVSGYGIWSIWTT